MYAGVAIRAWSTNKSDRLKLLLFDKCATPIPSSVLSLALSLSLMADP